MKFTYLDLIDPSISFMPVMATNWFEHKNGIFYSIFTTDETKKFQIPGYYGERCIIEIEMAKRLSAIQKKLMAQGLCLKVYDAYRPQKAVNFFTEWTHLADTPIVKKLHYPNVQKKNFHELSYLSRTSSHTLGTAVDVTIIENNKNHQDKEKSKDLLGVWDPFSLDMGNVGYLAFDKKSGHDFDDLTIDQRRTRKLLYDTMIEHGFSFLIEEFWHYYFDVKRNRDLFFDFDIIDDYEVSEDLSLKISMKDL